MRSVLSYTITTALCSNFGLSEALAFENPIVPDSNNNALSTKQISLPQNSFQLAKSTFLPEYEEGPFSGYTLDGDYNQSGNCSDKSSLYTKQNCSYPKAVVPSSQCPFLPGYYTECECLSKFKYTSCTAPYILGGDSCEGKYEKCVCPASVSLTYANDRCTKYCESKCIEKTCDPTPDQSSCTNGTTACDNGCGSNSRRCCVPCTNKVTSKPDNSSYTYSSCTDGNGSKQIQSGWKCNSGYHEKNGGCEKDCVANACSGFDLKDCPTNGDCSSCNKETTTCGGGGTFYKFNGCKSGFHWDGSSCVEHRYSCPSGYQESACGSGQVQTSTTSKVCSCGVTTGTCYACRSQTCDEQGLKDCNGSCIAKDACCGGCTGNKTCSNGSCVCPSIYKYTSSNCSGALGGSSCDGKFTTCIHNEDPDPSTSTSTSTSTSASCAQGGYYESNIGGNYVCKEVSYEGLTCYDCTNTTSKCPSDYQYNGSNCSGSFRGPSGETIYLVLAGKTCTDSRGKWWTLCTERSAS